MRQPNPLFKDSANHPLHQSRIFSNSLEPIPSFSGKRIMNPDQTGYSQICFSELESARNEIIERRIDNIKNSNSQQQYHSNPSQFHQAKLSTQFNEPIKSYHNQSIVNEIETKMNRNSINSNRISIDAVLPPNLTNASRIPQLHRISCTEKLDKLTEIMEKLKNAQYKSFDHMDQLSAKVNTLQGKLSGKKGMNLDRISTAYGKKKVDPIKKMAKSLPSTAPPKTNPIRSSFNSSNEPEINQKPKKTEIIKDKPKRESLQKVETSILKSKPIQKESKHFTNESPINESKPFINDSNPINDLESPTRSKYIKQTTNKKPNEIEKLDKLKITETLNMFKRFLESESERLY